MPTGRGVARDEGNGRFSVEVDHRIVRGQVVWTDYDHLALAYECFESNEDGTCKARRSTLVAYSRSNTELTEEEVETLMVELSSREGGKVCATREDFEKVPQKSKAADMCCRLNSFTVIGITAM